MYMSSYLFDGVSFLLQTYHGRPHYTVVFFRERQEIHQTFLSKQFEDSALKCRTISNLCNGSWSLGWWATKSCGASTRAEQIKIAIGSKKNQRCQTMLRTWNAANETTARPNHKIEPQNNCINHASAALVMLRMLRALREHSHADKRKQRDGPARKTRGRIGNRRSGVRTERVIAERKGSLWAKSGNAGSKTKQKHDAFNMVRKARSMRWWHKKQP